MVYGTVLIHTIHYRLIDLLALIPSSTVAAVEVLLVRTAAATDFESRSKQEKVFPASSLSWTDADWRMPDPSSLTLKLTPDFCAEFENNICPLHNKLGIKQQET